MNHLSLIFYISFLASVCFGQNERNIRIDIQGGDLVAGLNNTKWELKKIVRKDYGYGSKTKNRLARKTNPQKEEEQELYFKDGVVEIFHKQPSTKQLCKYRLRNNDEDSFHELFFLPIDPIPKDSTVYDVSVFKLSDKKLVIFINLRRPKSNPLYFTHQGRLIFYKKT